MTTDQPQSKGPSTASHRKIETNAPSPLSLLRVLESEYPDVPVIFHDTRDQHGQGVALIGVGEATRGPTHTTLDDGLSDVRRRLDDGRDAARKIPLFFHLSFDSEATSRSWEGFGQRSVTCPRLLWRWEPGVDAVRVSRLEGFEAPDDGPSYDQHMVDHLTEQASVEEGHGRPMGGSLEVRWPGVEAYRNAVAEAIEASRGPDALEKVVVARSGLAHSEQRCSPTAVLDGLHEQYGTARLFALAPSGLSNTTFLGASPERLIHSEGRDVRTMALAGTRERQAGEDVDALAEALMESAKDRAEHGYVARMIRETLEELGAEVDVAETPTPMILANVIHLETPIRARFDQADPPNIGRLVEALHPTPAVCGTPTERAMAFIREYERLDRGLYTGALGWQTSDGGGDTTVALRCGLVDGNRARIFAGGGVTADSDVDAELEETTAKFEPMLQALRRAGASQ